MAAGGETAFCRTDYTSKMRGRGKLLSNAPIDKRFPQACKRRSSRNVVDFAGNHMEKTREEILLERQRLRQRYDKLFEATVALLFRHDPVGVVFESNRDEYAPEAGTILPRLHACKSREDVLPIVYEEFLHWFGDAAGPRERYVPIASGLWELWQAYQSTE